MNKQQLIDELQRVTDAVDRLYTRRDTAQKRIEQIDQNFPALLVEYANGTKDDADLQAVEMEKIHLTTAAQAPYRAAAEQFESRIKAVRLALDSITNIERIRKQDAEFCVFFNSILHRRSLKSDDEEQLRSYAFNTPKFKEPVARLIEQLNDYNIRGFGANPVPFEVIVTVDELPEEPDNSEITINI